VNHGVLIIAVFLIFAALMYRRLMPALLAIPLMALVMTAVCGVVPASMPASLGTVILTGSAALAPVFVTVIFGAILGRVTLDTGIARSIVNFAAEFSGDRPAVVAAILCAVVAALFVSLTGLGAIIMVGSIVLPIMMTTGVPRRIAATMFLMSFALGFIFNIANWKFYTKFFGVEQQQLYGYAFILAAVDLAALVVYAVIAFRTTRDYATWAVEADETRPASVPWIALLTPVLPIVLYFAFHVDPLIAFPLSAVYGVLTTRPRRMVETFIAAAIRGYEDVAPAVLLFIGIGMLFTATKLPAFTAALAPMVSGGWLHNPLLFVLVFGLLSPLALYRGPLNPFGVGIAIFTVLLGAHVFPPIVLVAAIMAVVQVQNVCDPTNTANVWVGNFTGVHIEEITRRTLAYQVAVATLAAIAIVAGASRFFGVNPFSPLVSPAAAAQDLPGLFAPERAAFAVGVGSDGQDDSAAAAQAVIEALNRWPGVRAFSVSENPNAGDCSRKSYAAFAHISSTRFALLEGTDTDVGLELSDCAGWGVDEWHEHRVISPAPAKSDLRALGFTVCERMNMWRQLHPAMAQNLLSKGLAYDPLRLKPTFFYSLYKTYDGYMRAYVRPGGPAYVAGMRSGDIVDKLDDKFWWEYGTYQTQSRAYDGKPHTFDIERGDATVHIVLREPFTAE